ncbi:MAG TPA: hypothetical protein VFB08_15890 [Burkholderiales bacterium]|nr:hypothetical protein [Burkholderiales bacterium]
MAHRVLLTTLARYQTVFWIPVGERLRALGLEPAFLTFDDPSDALIRAAGLKSFNAFDLGAAGSANPAAVERELADVLGWTLPLAVSHERITFGLRDTRMLAGKLSMHRLAAGRALEALQSGGDRVTVVQELGGFLSVIGTFLAARQSGIANFFLEPSFFRGRFFATANSFAAPRPGAMARDGAPEPEALRQLELARASRAIVIPAKDRHHYTMALRKVANAANARRLLEKLYEKYGRRQRHEFGHLRSHVSAHLRMVANSSRLRRRYSEPPRGRPYVYYPLHVPADVALTLRSPQYLDQLALVDFLARTLPASHLLAIKEHPAQVGALDAGRLRALLERYDNLVLLPPSKNNYDVLAGCDLVVSINSKAGAEALLVGKPVLVLGDAFYTESGLVTRVRGLAELPGVIGQALANPPAPAPAEVERFFSAVWKSTLPGELYSAQDNNAAVFAGSLAKALHG